IAVLRGFGTAFLDQVYDPDVVAMYRLVIAAAEESPELSRAFDESARKPIRAAVAKVMQRARAAGVVSGTARALSTRLVHLLQVGLLPVVLGVEPRPAPPAIDAEVRTAVDAFLHLSGT